MTDDLIWEEPPAEALRAGQKVGRYREFAAALRERPQSWAILPTASKNRASAINTAANLRLGKMQGFTKGEFETAVHEQEGVVKLYVRFIGTAKGATAEHAPDGRTPGEWGPEVDPNRAQAIRAWARLQGKTVPERGRLSGALVDEYDRAQAANTPSSLGE